MKIKDKYGFIGYVFQIYWNDEETLFSVLFKGEGGLMHQKQSDVEIIDPRINYKTIFHPDGSWNIIVHWALAENKLLSRLYELEKEAYLEFLKIIKEEGLVEPDFY
ncbi:MAG: Hypothetical protein BHV28_16680 [Candidatus Tokpelaia hoelldobleri]|uniref:Uncharacterized protein n=1 Tax=Candidatus Tokpelaia hoelldobleri TaxID=1902579 RepID=A0A1U9JWV5_9HYPH|nr:MAG: Hypothetical protein BHV28_16680 [Candidatus Tokpelaia hoelldoblerii]